LGNITNQYQTKTEPPDESSYRLLTWLKKFWWAVLAALAFVAGLFLRGRSTQPPPPNYGAAELRLRY